MTGAALLEGGNGAPRKPRAESRAAPKTTLASDTRAPSAVRRREALGAEAAARRSLKAGQAAAACAKSAAWSSKNWGEDNAGAAGSPGVAAAERGC